MKERNQGQVKMGYTPLGQALVNVNKILDKATEPYTLLDILKQIREEDVYSIKWVPGRAGQWRAKRVK